MATLTRRHSRGKKNSQWKGIHSGPFEKSAGGIAAQVVQVRAATPVDRGQSIKPNQVALLRIRLKLSQTVFARLLPASTRSIAALEAGAKPSESIARRLTELERMSTALAEIMNENAIGSWLQCPNQAFDNLKPIEVIERGENDRIWSMIYFVRSGVPS